MTDADHAGPAAKDSRSCGAPPLSTPDQRNRFLFHLRQHTPALSGHGPDSISSGSMASTLLLELNKDDLHYQIIGATHTVAHEAPRWRQVVEAAVASFKADQAPPRSWSAVLGPSPHQGAAFERGFTLPQRLHEPISIGPMTLSAIPEWTTQVLPHPGDRSRPYPVSFWPIQVHGTVNAYSTEGARDLAAYDLDRLRLLLSLALPQLWIHWTWPEIEDSDFIYNWQREMRHCWRPKPAPTVPPVAPLLIPQWVPDAWPLLGKHHSKTLALEAANNALLDVAEGRHSAAGVQLVAVLEQLHDAIHGNRRDPAVGRKGAHRLVAEFLAEGNEVTSEHRSLAKHIVMYPKRSSTSHEGARHGYEPRLGMPLRMTSLGGDRAHTYRLKIEILRDICSSLLIEQLGGPPVQPGAIKDRWQAIADGHLILPTHI